MSNLSNIGFEVQSEEEFEALSKKVFKIGQHLKVKKGRYIVFSDKSGAEIWVQRNRRDYILGFNPHFKGKSKRVVGLTAEIDRGKYDGAFYAWANPVKNDEDFSGDYPFVFDMPDRKKYDIIEFPQKLEIQLSAFPFEMNIFDNEIEFENSQEEDWKMAAQSFIPSGLFSAENENKNKSNKSLAVFAGIIKSFEKKRNSLTQQEFYWLLVDTLGGEIDVVAELSFFEKEPKIDGVVMGQFWLSGQFLTPPIEKERKGIFDFFNW